MGFPQSSLMLRTMNERTALGRGSQDEPEPGKVEARELGRKVAEQRKCRTKVLDLRKRVQPLKCVRSCTRTCVLNILLPTTTNQLSPRPSKLRHPSCRRSGRFFCFPLKHLAQYCEDGRDLQTDRATDRRRESVDQPTSLLKPIDGATTD